MPNYNVVLETKVDESDYFIKRAANSVDLDVSKKLTHKISINGDIESNYNIGLIIENSGSGKTTFAKKYFGEESFKTNYDENISLINQFNSNISYDERVKILSSIGLNSIPAWVKPISVLSNGEKARAEIAIRLQKKELIVIDEFTSVVDRNVAKIMSHSIQKFARKNNKKIVLISVHNDIIDWLNPDWIIDMNEQNYNDRRLLCSNFKREETIEFKIKECSRESWKYFSKFHYLSDNLPGGKIYLYGLFVNDKQIGFQCFANYNPKIKKMYHSNRTVIDPEYTGMGLGIRLINITSEYMSKKGFIIMGKFSNKAIYESMIKCKDWVFLGSSNNLNKSQYKPGGSMSNQNVRRKAVMTYNFKYINHE